MKGKIGGAAECVVQWGGREFVGKTLVDLGFLRSAWPLRGRTRLGFNVDEGQVCLY